MSDLERHKESTMSKRFLIGRRQFLITSSVGVVAAATIGPNLFASEAAKRLAVGYCGLEDDAVVRSASSVSSGDGAFITRGARISVDGIAPKNTAPRARRAVELLAHYPYFDGAERRVAPVHAWGSSRRNGDQGSPVSFTMPLDEIQQKITLTVGAESGAPAGVASRRDALSFEQTGRVTLPIELTVQNHDGMLKLARGYYIVAPLFESDSEPRWSAYALQSVEGRRQLVDGNGTPAGFEYFLLRIDYAAA
jgi:hypothetical protein